MNGDEQCDDGNDDNSDGCTTLCAPPACDDGIISGDESDLDCGGSCDNACELGAMCNGGGDCQQHGCTDGVCTYATSCADILAQDENAADGEYMVDMDGEGGEEPFTLSCDMTTDGGGWIRLRLNDSDNVIVAEYDVTNPWLKCEDDSAKHFDWVGEDGITADFSPNNVGEYDVPLVYENPDSVTDYTVEQMALIRGVIAELNPATRMVGLTSDDDSGNWQNDMSGGHEVYVTGDDQNWTLLTVGEDGECGGGQGSWPLANSESGYYLWNHSDADSVVDGQTTAVNADLGGLATTELVPTQVRLIIDTGGGAAFGYETQIFLVR